MYATVPITVPGLVKRSAGAEDGGQARGSLVCNRLAFRFQHGEAEVQELRLLSLGHEDVRGLDVAVDDALGVGGLERVGDLDGQVEQRFRGQGPALDAVLQGPSLQALEGDELLALALSDVVDGADAGVVEGGRRLGLPPEALEGLRVLGQLLREELEGDGPAQARVLGLVDDAHAAAAELPEDAVVGHGLPDQGRLPLPATTRCRGGWLGQTTSETAILSRIEMPSIVSVTAPQGRSSCPHTK